MKKLKLKLEDLKVESFDTTPDQHSIRAGTVFAYSEETYLNTSCENTWDYTVCQTCNYQQTCDWTGNTWGGYCGACS